MVGAACRIDSSSDIGPRRRERRGAGALASILALVLALCVGCTGQAATAPQPLLRAGQPVAWWIVFKFNAATFPGCGGAAARACLFGGTVQSYRHFGDQFAYASSSHPALAKGAGCSGDTDADPVGATFAEVYDGSFNYLLWNDQFYDDPAIRGCSKSCSSPWGHSKGLLAWNDEGAGLVMQVTTPSWPASGSREHPRASDGNTLGCVTDDNILVSQHFFALKLTHADLVSVLQALANASAVTDPDDVQIVRNGGPADVQQLVRSLGHKSRGKQVLDVTLSSGVRLISKPSALHVPPWQLVSAELGGLPLRAATWWAAPRIPSTTSATPIGCWDARLGTPGAVEIATAGNWNGMALGLIGTASPRGNHAKIGVSTDGRSNVVILGDLNQQGVLSGHCGRSQNGRGGLFYVVHDPELWRSVAGLITEGPQP